MKSFKLALVQHASPVGRRAENLRATIEWVRKAHRKGAELVCLPELGITGHAGHHAMIAEAEPVPGGPSVGALCETARELGIFICAGIAEDDRGIHYNTQFVVGPDGYAGKQRKIHLSRDEYFFFRGGTQLPVLDLPMARVGVIICYDNEMPELSRCLAVKGAELLLCPHAARFGTWPRTDEGRRKAVADFKSHWTLMHSCRARDNACYVALCNTAGRSATGLKDVEANHAGGCMVFDPYGNRAAQSRSRDITDEMLVVELDAGAIEKRRRETCLPLRTRRPEVFSALTEPTG
jgi:predicted amidohydrolase